MFWDETVDKWYQNRGGTQHIIPTTTSELPEGTNEYYTDAKVAAKIGTTSIDALSDVNTTSTPPVTNNALTWNGTAWVPGTPNANATTVTLTSAGDVNANFFVPIANASTGNQALYSDSTLTYNPNTNLFPTAGIQFVNQLAVTANDDRPLNFGLSTGGTQRIYVDGNTNDRLTYNSSTQTLKVKNAIVSGDLTVNGTATYINTTDLNVKDNIITLNYGVTGTPTLNAGIEVERGDSANTQLRWNESTDSWQYTNDGTNYFDIGVAQTVALTATNGTNATHYLTFVDSATGNEVVRTDTALSYNPSTNTLSAGTFSGTATLASRATTVDVTETDGSASYNLVFVDSAGSEKTLRSDDTLTYHAFNNSLTVGNNGSLSAYNITASNQLSTTGALQLTQTGSTTPGVVFRGPEYIDGSTTVTFKVPTIPDVHSNVTFNLPIVDGTANQVLKTDGSGNLSWTALDGRNLTYSGSTLDLDKTLVDVNSVASESGQLLTLQGSQIRLEGRIDGSSTGMFNAVTEGYLFGSTGSTPGSIAGPSATGGIAGFISSTGTTTDEMYRYQWKGDISTGSNQILNCRVYSATEFTVATPLTWDSTIVNRVVGKPVHYGGGTSFPTTPARFPLGARVQSVSIDPGNPTLATVTLEASDLAANANSTATTTGAVGSFSHYARNSTSTYVVLINSTTATGADAPGTMRVSEALATPTGYLTSISVAYFSHSYTVAPTLQVTGRKRIRLQTDNPINEHINVPFGLGVGPGAVSTNRGIPLDPSDAIGINLYNPGTVNGYTGRTIFNLTQSTDNSFYTAASATPGSGVPVEKSGGQFSFNHIRGNANSAISAIYGRNGDGLGGITWWSNAGSSATSLVSSTHTTAGIYAAATEDHTGNATGGNSGAQANASGKHGSGVAMQYTPNASGISRPRTFLLANDKTVELRSVDSVVLKPVSKTVSNITDRALFSTVNHTWLTAGDYVLGNAASNTTSMTNGTGAKVTVGITSASGNNGDVGLVLQRATGNTANFELKLPTGSSNTLQLINNATSTTIATVTDSAIAVNATTRVTGGQRTYGEFAYTAGQITPTAADTVLAFPLDTTNTASGVTISNTRRVNINRSGFYKLIMSLQVKNINNSADHLMRFWLRKDGVDVANSSTVITPLKLQEQVIAMDWLVESNGSNYFEIMYYVNDTNVVFPYYGTLTTPVVAPAAPPIILNVIPIGL